MKKTLNKYAVQKTVGKIGENAGNSHSTKDLRT